MTHRRSSGSIFKMLSLLLNTNNLVKSLTVICFVPLLARLVVLQVIVSLILPENALRLSASCKTSTSLLSLLSMLYFPNTLSGSEFIDVRLSPIIKVNNLKNVSFPEPCAEVKNTPTSGLVAGN